MLFASSEISSGVEPTIASDAWISVHFAPWRAERHCDEYDVPSPAKKGIISINYFNPLCAKVYLNVNDPQIHLRARNVWATFLLDFINYSAIAARTYTCRYRSIVCFSLIEPRGAFKISKWNTTNKTICAHTSGLSKTSDSTPWCSSALLKNFIPRHPIECLSSRIIYY